MHQISVSYRRSENQLDMASLLLLLLLCLLPSLRADPQYGPCPDNKYKYAGATHSACLLKSPKAEPFKMTDALREELLDAHNNYRRGVEPPATNMLKMTWDSDLEMLATKWAESCEWGHDSYSQKSVPQSFAGAGQNGFKGGRLGNMTSIVSVWQKEVKYFTYGSDESWRKILHFTQNVWATSYKLGCGGAFCDGTGLFYCNYGPAGNWAGSLGTPYKNGTRSSDCLKDDGGICDCGDIHCHSGDLDPKTCKCTCDAQTTSGPFCEWTGIKCEDSMGTSSCENMAKYNGGKEMCNNYKGWAKKHCFKFCDHCCENRIGDWQCEQNFAQYTKHACCEGRWKDWGKDKCYKMCGHC